MQFSCTGMTPASANMACNSRRRRKRSSSIWSSASRTAKLMMRIIFVPSRCMRGIARRASASEVSNGSSIFLPQLAMADPKQLTPTPAACRRAQTRSNSASGRSWMFFPPTPRDSMNDQPNSLVALICSSMSFAASSANPV